MFFPKNNPFV